MRRNERLAASFCERWCPASQKLAAKRSGAPMSRPKLTVVLSQARARTRPSGPWRRASPRPSSWSRGWTCRSSPTSTILTPKHTGRLFLESVTGDMVVLAGCTRGPPSGCSTATASRGTSARPSSSRRRRTTRRKEGEAGAAEGHRRGGRAGPAHLLPRPARLSSHTAFVEEIRRIAAECRERRESKPRSGQQPAHGRSWACRRGRRRHVRSRPSNCCNSRAAAGIR